MEPPATTAVARPSAWVILVTGASNTTLEPWPSTSVWHRSHIIPGPCFGYWNSSMRLVTCWPLPRFPANRARNGSHTAVQSVMPLMRWAPHSAEISDGGTAHTFVL